VIVPALLEEQTRSEIRKRFVSASIRDVAASFKGAVSFVAVESVRESYDFAPVSVVGRNVGYPEMLIVDGRR
jgi:hypothetical protein